MSEDAIPNLEGVTWTTIEPDVVLPSLTHRFTAILCHGRGSTGPVYKNEFFESESSKGLDLRAHFPSVKWVFPSAGLPFDPRVPVEEEAQWFALSSLQDPQLDQVRQQYGISESIKYLHQIIDQEIDLLKEKDSRVILGGISQGSAVAVHALLSRRHPLNSFVGFCSWLPFQDAVDLLATQRPTPRLAMPSFYRENFAVDPPARRSRVSVLPPQVLPGHYPLPAHRLLPTLTPCFLSHNADDDVVGVKLGRSLRDALRNLGMRVTWDEHGQGNPSLRHWIKEPEGIDRLVAFLEVRMGINRPQNQLKISESGSTER